MHAVALVVFWGQSVTMARPTSRALARAAREALAEFNVSPRARMKRMHDGENTIWRVYPPREQKSLVLRLHGYQPASRIEAELAWLDALAQDLPGLAPKPQEAWDGSRLQVVPVAGMSSARPASLLTWIEGRMASWPGHPNALSQLGALSAKLHSHAQGWRSPAKQRRPKLGFEEHAGDTCHWGIAPLAVPGLRAAQRQYLEGILDDLRAMAAQWSRRRNTVNLIHADLHLGNSLFAVGVARAIDFDDCARTWFMMDPAVTLLSASLNDGAPRRIEAFWSGYAEEGGAIPVSDFEHLPTFQLMRMITMYAWSWTRSSHPRIKQYHPMRRRMMMSACRAWSKSDGSSLT